MCFNMRRARTRDYTVVTTLIFGQFSTQMPIVKRSQGQLHTSNLTLNKKWMGIENLEQHSRVENQIPCIDF